MLQVSYIRENRDEVLQRLSVKNFKLLHLIDEVLLLDDKRRQTQNQLDNLSAEANAIAKEIGELMKKGDKEQAGILKNKTQESKEAIKVLLDALNTVEQQLYDSLVLIPNLPHSSVPKGIVAEDNETVLELGNKPILLEGALPHWELATR